MGALNGKVAVVTGAASGIGRATVERLCRENAAVVAVDVNEDALRRLADAVSGDLVTARCDVRIPDDVASAIRLAEERYGRLTTVCNCAGVYDNIPFLQLTDDQWRRSLEINLGGVFNSCRAAIPALQRAGGGSIINLASANAMVAAAGEAAYSASKGAVLMLTKAIAIEHAADNIRVNAVCPGFVDTPMIAAMADNYASRDDMLADVRKLQPLGIGRPEDIAAVVCFLASDDSRSMTASAVVTDGGFTAI